MRILGDIMDRLLSLMIFRITLVLYTLYLVVKIIGNTLVGSFFGLLELLQVKREE
jgi:hypothetical protein